MLVALPVSWCALWVGSSIYQGAGTLGMEGLIAFALLLLSVVSGTMVLMLIRRRRLNAAAARRWLEKERAMVRESVDTVLDPTLTQEETLEIVDGLIRPPARHTDRYVVVTELSAPSQVLMNRARKAVTTVNSAEVKRQHLLDDVANDLVLPQQLWEIARILRAQTHLRQEQRKARQGVVTPELRAVLEPQQAALERSIAAVTARVSGLERYAYRVQEADAALRAREALANNDKYRDLLAQTDDEQGMRELNAQSKALETTLARSVRDAVEAGQTLNR